MGSILAPSQKDDRKEACKTYIEQTKLLVTLASAFVLAPIALIGYIRNDKTLPILSGAELRGLMVAEGFFVLSVLLGYVVLGALAGTQHDGTFDVFRPAIRITSLIQFFSYLVGLGMLAFLLTSWSIQNQSGTPSQILLRSPEVLGRGRSTCDNPALRSLHLVTGTSNKGAGNGVVGSVPDEWSTEVGTAAWNAARFPTTGGSSSPSVSVYRPPMRLI